ncbi:MAG: AAA-like domain-containing protein [Anaerolineae bacterium]|nr:AAA-like domain-containing protein [Anaerolineae bacterium]
MTNLALFTIGGTVQAGGGLYLARQADEELLTLCRAGEFAYVLTSRQMGKSSLMIRTAERLAEEGIRSALIDLTQVGTQVTAEAWYLGLLTALEDNLTLETDTVKWWQDRSHLSFSQRLTLFCQEVLLAEITTPLVIFADEIDSTLGLDFTDDFYTAIRYLYNARAITPVLQRLSFVLIGVATPGDLIVDPHRTPFNIGRQVDLSDFSFEEALPLATGLGLPLDQAKQVLAWALHWSGGHPYLTQRLCRALAEQRRTDWSDAEVERTVAALFLGRMSEQDHNLQFVRDMLTKRAFDPAAVLTVYRQIRLGRRPVADEEQSRVKAHLKLSGIVRREKGQLWLRNPIYAEVFNAQWIQEHQPVRGWDTVPPGIKIAAGVIAILVIFLVISLIYAVGQQRQAQAEANAHATEVINRTTAEANAIAAQETAQTEANARANEVAIRSTAEANAVTAQETAQAEANIRATEVVARSTAEANAIAAQATAEAEKVAAQRQSRILLAQSLAAPAPYIVDPSDTELKALLAVEALHLNRQEKGNIQALIDSSLRGILSVPFFNTTLKGHTGSIYSVAFSPDGQTLASTGQDSSIRLWKLADPSVPPTILTGHKGRVWSLAFSPDGHILASAGEDETIRLWTLADLRASPTILAGHKGTVISVAFSPDSQTLVSAGEDKTIHLWQLANLKASPAVLVGHSSNILSVAFSPNGQTLVSGADDKTIRVWNLSDLSASPTILTGHENFVMSVAFSPDGQTLASASGDKTIRLWDLANLKASPTILTGHENYVISVAFSPDGQTLASAGWDKTIRLWDLANLKTSPTILAGHGDVVYSIAFSPDGQSLASVGEDKMIRLWELGTPSALPVSLGENKNIVMSVAFSPDGQTLASAGQDTAIRLWNLADLTESPTTLMGHLGRIWSVAFSPNGQTLVSAGQDTTIHLWKLTDLEASPTVLADGKKITLTNREDTILTGQQDIIFSVAFSPDGQTLASASDNVRLWNLADPSASPTVLTGTLSVAFSPDGQTLASASGDGIVRLWKLADLKAPPTLLTGPKKGIWAVAFSPDSQTLASAGLDNTVYLWNLATLETTHILTGHEDMVFSVAFSPNGQTLASASSDTTIRLWDLANLTAPPVTLRGRAGPVLSVAFSLDGQTLASGGRDQSVHLWPTLDKLGKLACQKVRRNLSQVEWNQYLLGETYHRTCPNLPAGAGAPADAPAAAEF